jgi:hypothetical protein
LYDIFSTTDTNDITRVQPGSNITTGGTSNNPIINLVDSPSINGLSFSGNANGSTLEIITLSASTLYSGSTDISNLFATPGNITTINSQLATKSNLSGATFTGTVNASILNATTLSATTYYNIPTSFGTGANGGGGTISTGVTGYFVIGYTGRITGWDLIGSTSGTAVVDIWKTTGSTLPTVLNSITASAKPRITEGVYSGSTTLTGWSGLSYNAGDKFGFNIDLVTGFTTLTLTIRGFKEG